VAYADAFPPSDDPEEVGDYYWNEYIPLLRHEPDVFVAQHVLSGEGTLRALLTSTTAWVSDDAIAVAYGNDATRSATRVTWSTFDDAAAMGAAYSEPEFEGEYVEVELDPKRRAGIFTLASFLSATAGPRQPSPVHRGVKIIDRLLCRELHPPADVPPLEGAATGEMPRTNREKYEAHTQNPACSGCHAQIDGIGLTFEHYDSLGRYRTEDNGFTVDASGALVGTDVDRPVHDAIELVHTLADSRGVHDCYTTQWFRYAFGRDETDDDAELLAELQQGFWDSDGNVRALLLEIAASAAFRHRSSP
jgi:hypothetical protein